MQCSWAWNTFKPFTQMNINGTRTGISRQPQKIHFFRRGVILTSQKGGLELELFPPAALITEAANLLPLISDGA